MEAFLYVAGIFSGSWIIKNPFDEAVADGFIQAEEFKDGTSEGEASSSEVWESNWGVLSLIGRLRPACGEVERVERERTRPYC